MQTSKFHHLPELAQLLQKTDSSSYKVLTGKDILKQRFVSDIVLLNAHCKAGDLVIAELDDLITNIKLLNTNLSGIALYSKNNGCLELACKNLTSANLTRDKFSKNLKSIISSCEDLDIPLISFSELIDSTEIIQLLKPTLIQELLLNNHKLQTLLFDIVISLGLKGLVEYCQNNLNISCLIQNAKFIAQTDSKILELKSKEKQKILDQVKKTNPHQLTNLTIEYLNHLTMPITVNDIVVAYVTIETNNHGDLNQNLIYLRAINLATSIYFKVKTQESTIFTNSQFNILNELLTGRELSVDAIENLERHFSLDLCEHILVLACNTPIPIETGPRLLDKNIIYTVVENTHVFLMSFYTASKSENFQDLIMNSVATLKSVINQDLLQIGIGRPANNIFELPKIYKEARQALIIGSMINTQDFNEFVYYYPNLGVRRLLYLIIDHPELKNYYMENLQALEKYDEEWESELVNSLKIYLEHGANLNSAARALFIHRHTLNYRLEQIVDILKRDIDSQEVLLDLKIAFLIKEMLGNDFLKE